MSVTFSSDGVPLYTSPNGTVYIAGGKNSTCTIDVCPISLSIYGYRTSLAFSSLLIALYALCAAAHLFLGIRYRNKTWGFTSCMLVGCLLELLGFVGRILMWNDPWGRSGFIMQIVLITIAPVFFTAGIYVMICQIANFISASSSRFRPEFFYWLFIPCDIISLVLQAVGGGMSASSNDGSNAGVNIALAGLAFQVFTLAVFIVAVADYMVRSRQVWTNMKLGWRFKSFAVFLGAATLLILIRCCYRVYELSEGYSRTSTALRDQSLFIALEGVMVIVAAWCLVAAHPGPVFYSRKSQSTEKVGETKV